MPPSKKLPPPTLPAEDKDPSARADQLALYQDLYRFVHDWPEGIATASVLPKDESYSKSYSAKAIKTYISIGANTAGVVGREATPLRALKGAVSAFKELKHETLGQDIFSNYDEHAERIVGSFKPEAWQDYADLFAAWDEPDIVAKVVDEASLSDSMAWQRIAGVNPMVLTRCTALPGHFPVTEAHFKRALPGDSLQAALEEGRAFLADYTGLEGVPCGITDGIQKYLAGPVALYVADRSGTLRAVAVQCGRDPSQHPVRTPGDGWHWRMANYCVQVADANHHEGSAHLGRTHMVMEAATLAMRRELAANHPISVLLAPHTETTLAINASAKTSLIARGGTVDTVFAAQIRSFGDFVKSQVSTFSLKDSDPRTALAARGLDDREVLPVHPYRDDVIPVWDAIRAHVDSYVRLYYHDAATVQSDSELQAFVLALAAQQGGRLHDVPSVQSVDEVIELISRLVFIATAQHSAVNFPQFRFMAYSPNMAGALFSPVPDRSTPNTPQAFEALLPPAKTAYNGATMVYLLSDMQSTTLGKYEADAFSDPRVTPLIARFQATLRGVEAGAVQRDATRWLPYPYLQPSKILQSISI